MRYLDEVIFISNGSDGYYDYDLGEYISGEATQTTLRVNVTDLGSERSKVLFGDIKQGRKVIRFRPLAEIPVWDLVQFEDKKYQLAKALEPLDRNTLIVEEVA